MSQTYGFKFILIYTRRSPSRPTTVVIQGIHIPCCHCHDCVWTVRHHGTLLICRHYNAAANLLGIPSVTFKLPAV